MGDLEALCLRLAEEIVGVQDHQPLGADAGLAEDLRHVAHGIASEDRAAREDPVDVLQLLLSLADGLGDVGGGGVGGRDVDDIGHATLLGKSGDGGDVRRVIAAREELGAGVDQSLRFRAGDVGLGLAVRVQQLETGAPHGLDAARGVDGLRGHLRPELRILADLRHGTRDRADHADLDRARLGPEERGKSGHADGRGRGSAKKCASTYGHGHRSSWSGSRLERLARRPVCALQGRPATDGACSPKTGLSVRSTSDASPSVGSCSE